VDGLGGIHVWIILGMWFKINLYTSVYLICFKSIIRLCHKYQKKKQTVYLCLCVCVCVCVCCLYTFPLAIVFFPIYSCKNVWGRKASGCILFFFNTKLWYLGLFKPTIMHLCITYAIKIILRTLTTVSSQITFLRNHRKIKLNMDCDFLKTHYLNFELYFCIF
jgi:hypothetical protein